MSYPNAVAPPAPYYIHALEPYMGTIATTEHRRADDALAWAGAALLQGDIITMTRRAEPPPSLLRTQQIIIDQAVARAQS